MQMFYTVRRGDTLYQIAKRWELPVESVIAANNLIAPFTIYIGQQLSIPPGVHNHRVKQGETVNKISQFYGVPLDVIVKANQLESSYLIHVNQMLKIPPGYPYYIVRRGDTLYQLAKSFNIIIEGRINPEPIRMVNHLQSNVIYPGMKLKIPYVPPMVGGMIAYTSNRGGNYDLWLYNPKNGKNIQITNGEAEANSVPVWSWDSRKIAFVGKNSILYVVYLDQDEMAKIDQFEDGIGIGLDWSHDSNKLAYSKNNEIVLYNIHSHQSQKINQVAATDISWFPDDETLLFQATDAGGVCQLYRISVNGSNKHQITRNTGGRLNNVRLSPDGTYALYTTPGASISIIYTVEIASGNIFEVEGGPLAKNYFPEWSPNSQIIAYSATAFEDRGYFSLINTVGRKGDNDHTWAISDCFATPVTWSPDDRKIGYLSGCSDQGTASELWVVDVKHPAPIRLIEGVQITALQWSPTSMIEIWKMYTNSMYKIQFKYPAHWQKVNDERYEGEDGFFQISAIAGEDTIDDLCKNEAYHQLKPYGSQPLITKSMIQKEDACFIFPSNDQPQEMKNQAALIIKYPNPIQIEGINYNSFILWANQNNIKAISSSLFFLS